MKTRSKILRGLLGLSYHIGGPVVSDLLRGKRTIILIYHGIPNRDHFDGIANYYGYSIPGREFERHLVYLKRRCNVVSFNDLLTGNGLSRTKTNVVLTFDDGYENHYTNVFRLLQRYDLPAVFALPTAFICRREPLWDDVIEYAVSRCAKSHVAVQWQGTERQFVLDNFCGRLDLYNWLMRQSVQMDQERRDEFIRLVLEALAIPAGAEQVFQSEDYRPLSRAQIQEMVKSGLVSFASHSVHHYLLAKCALETKRAELRDSKRQVEELTDTACKTLCLPGGSYDSEVLHEAFEAGYGHVLTSDAGPVLNGRRVLNRNGIFREHDLHKFADLVHGPVFEILQASGRARGAIRALLN